MKKRDILLQFKAFIENNGGFRFHALFIDELGRIINKEASGHESELFTLLAKQMSFVKELNTSVYQADSNEILKTNTPENYYSLHIQDKILNVRLLMSFINGQPVFLAAFNEKSGKRVTEYGKWISVIIERYRDILGGEHNE